jgi:regulator of sigma E protease
MKIPADRLRSLATLALVVLGVVLFWSAVKAFVIFAFTLGVLIFVHEWGHFIAARAIGVHVFEFAIGMGPRLCTYMRRGGTDFTIRLIPIGGFVNPKGMQPEDPITPDGLNGRRPAERALLYLAGPAMNVVLGIFILFFTGFAVGKLDENTVLVGGVERKTPASRMEVLTVNGEPATEVARGLRVGDRILKVNDIPVTELTTVTDTIHAGGMAPVTLEVMRGADRLVLQGIPEQREQNFPDWVTVRSVPPTTDLALQPGDMVIAVGEARLDLGARSLRLAQETLQKNAGRPIEVVVYRDGRRKVTVTGTAGFVDLELRPGTRYITVLGFSPALGLGPRTSLAESVTDGWRRLQGFAAIIVSMFSSTQRLGESVGGPIAIFAALSQADRLPPYYYVGFMASLSLSLALFNLFPIPMLDGGHMLVLTVEVLRRRRLDVEAHRRLMLVGLTIIGVLFLLITQKDIISNFF